MILGYQQIQSQPRFAMQKAEQHHLSQQDNFPLYSHAAAVVYQMSTSTKTTCKDTDKKLL